MQCTCFFLPRSVVVKSVYIENSEQRQQPIYRRAGERSNRRATARKKGRQPGAGGLPNSVLATRSPVDASPRSESDCLDPDTPWARDRNAHSALPDLPPRSSLPTPESAPTGLMSWCRSLRGKVIPSSPAPRQTPEMPFLRQIPPKYNQPPSFPRTYPAATSAALGPLTFRLSSRSRRQSKT